MSRLVDLTSNRSSAYCLLLVLCLMLTACQPSDTRPGLWLRGQEAASFPEHWLFTDAYPEIFVQVKTPYLVPHSVTIWCVQVDGKLYIGARNPESKNWVGWMENDPAITLKIADILYQATINQVADESRLALIKAAYAQKYNLSAKAGENPPPMRYWLVTSQAG